MQSGCLHYPLPLGYCLSLKLKMSNKAIFIKKPYDIFFYAEKYSLTLLWIFVPSHHSIYSKHLSLTSQSHGNSLSIKLFTSSENSKEWGIISPYGCIYLNVLNIYINISPNWLYLFKCFKTNPYFKHYHLALWATAVFPSSFF